MGDLLDVESRDSKIIKGERGSRGESEGSWLNGEGACVKGSVMRGAEYEAIAGVVGTVVLHRADVHRVQSGSAGERLEAGIEDSKVSRNKQLRWCESESRESHSEEQSAWRRGARLGPRRADARVGSRDHSSLLRALKPRLDLFPEVLWLGDVLECLMGPPCADDKDGPVVQDHAENGLDDADALHLCELDL